VYVPAIFLFERFESLDQSVRTRFIACYFDGLHHNVKFHKQHSASPWHFQLIVMYKLSSIDSETYLANIFTRRDLARHQASTQQAIPKIASTMAAHESIAALACSVPGSGKGIDNDSICSAQNVRKTPTSTNSAPTIARRIPLSLPFRRL
jgi:hypothetical protein